MRNTRETIDLERTRLRGRDMCVPAPLGAVLFQVIPVNGGAMS